MHPDDVGGYLDRFRAAFADREAFEGEFRLQRYDGAYRHILAHAAPEFDADGNFTGFIGSCSDTDDRRTSGTSVADDFFEKLVDNVAVAGFDGYFKRLNSSWERTLGWTRDELLAAPILDFVHPEDREVIHDWRAEMKRGVPIGPVVNRYRRKDGGYCWFEWKSVADTDRRLVYAVARDISEQKQTEERLREAEADQAKLRQQLIFADRMATVGTLAAGVAHEINNPLALVANNIALMLEELQRSPDSEVSPDSLADLKAMARDAQEGAERIRKIVKGLKTFAPTDHGQTTVIDVVEVLEMSIDMVSNEIRHRARLVKEFSDLPPVEADDAQLRQVFVNLLLNAAQAFPQGNNRQNEIRITTLTDADGRAVIEVCDSGVGIGEATLGRIFDPFFTTKPVGVGTGLGLSICRNAVTGMGGEITATSEVGRGTTFRITLPAAQRTEVAPEPPAIAPAEESRASVLVLDDEVAIGTVLARILRDHDVTTTTTGAEALELLESGEDYHIIFSDLMMPGMSGMEFYEALSLRFPSVAERVVFMSGGAFTAEAQEFLERAENRRLDKPFRPPAVRELVQQYAGEHAR